MLQHPSIQLWSLPERSPSKMLSCGQDRSSNALMATGEITGRNRLVIVLCSHVHTLAQGGRRCRAPQSAGWASRLGSDEECTMAIDPWFVRV